MHYVVTMNEYLKFSELILEKVSAIFDKYKVDFSKNVEDGLRGVEKELSPLPLTEEEEFYSEIFRQFGEIDTSLKNIGYIPVFIKKPFRKLKAYQEAGITRNSYLRYHVEHYLMEVDILKNRVTRLLARLSKMLLKGGRGKESRLVLEVKESFLKSMKSYTKVRDSHVHEIRFDDAELWRLTGFELASNHSQDEDLELLTTFLYGKAKKQWSERISHDSKNLREVTNAVFGALIPIVFPSEAQTAE